MKTTLKVLWLLACVNLIQGFLFDKFNKFEKKVPVKEKCTTVYDNIKCGYCDTKYHDSCVKETTTVCRPTYVKVCNPEPLESCSFVKEDKCMNVPIPSCEVTWQKKCTDKLVCSKTFEVTVPTIPNRFCKFGKCKTFGEEEPSSPPPKSTPPPTPAVDVTVTRSAPEEVIAPEEAIGDSEFNNVGSQIEQQVANRRKRSLVSFSGGFKICKFGRCKTFGEPTPPTTKRVDPTPAPPVGDSEFNNVGSQIGQQVANAKRSTSDVIAPEDVIDDSETANRQRRSLVGDEVEEVEDDSELINLDSQIVEEIAERRRRSLEEDEEVEELEVEYETDFVDELDDLEENESDDESEENHGERQKRGLGWLNKQKPQKNCVTQKKCVNIPKKNCGIHKKETCIPFPKKKCETKMIEKCQTVQRQECGEAVIEKCTSIPQKDCKEVIERRPRLVCPPPPTTRTISEPVYAREADISPPTYTKDSLINRKLGKFRG